MGYKEGKAQTKGWGEPRANRATWPEQVQTRVHAASRPGGQNRRPGSPKTEEDFLSHGEIEEYAKPGRRQLIVG